MSIVLHSNAVQTAAWYYKTATIIDWANDVNAKHGDPDYDCMGCCCLKSRSFLCPLSEPLFYLENSATLMQNGILTKDEYTKAMWDFSKAVTQPMCCFPIFCVSSCLFLVPGVGCFMCCCQRYESNQIINSLSTTMKTLNEEHASKQVHWSVNYSKPTGCYSCCLPFNYWRLEAVASPPRPVSYANPVSAASAPPPPPPPFAPATAAYAPSSPYEEPVMATAEVIVENPIQKGGDGGGGRRLSSSAGNNNPVKDIATSIAELAKLRDQGILTEEEFVAAKAKVING
jgi:hypothetical protein